MRKTSSPQAAVRRSRSRRAVATVTIKEVASEASVSVATVSRVLNEKGSVREQTRRRIRRAVEKLHYAPHGAARSLIIRQTHTLAVLLPDLFGEFFSELIRGVDMAARRSGYHLLLSGSHGSRKELEAMLLAIRGRVDGLIALSPDLDGKTFENNLPAGFPVVLLNGDGRGNSYHSIRIDNYGGAFAVVRHLIGLGHRRIAFVTGPARNHDAAERMRGYRKAMEGEEDSSALEVSGDFREESGYRAGSRILLAKPRPTAVFAANDTMAIGLLCAFRENHVRVPDDIAIAGFDDIPIARFIMPPLTTVRVPIAELGSRATARLLHVLEGNDGHAQPEEILPTALIVRSSCGALVRARAVASPGPHGETRPGNDTSRVEDSTFTKQREGGS